MNWINVKDRLPEAETTTWAVWINPKSGARFVADAWIDQSGRWVNDEAVLTSMGYYVTHWMEKEPRPEPPEATE